jgi:hypothetical protein
MNECTYFHLEMQYWCWVFAPQCRLAFQPAVLEMPALKKKTVEQKKYCKKNTASENVEISRHECACCLHHKKKAILSNNMSIFLRNTNTHGFNFHSIIHLRRFPMAVSPCFARQKQIIGT